MTEYNKLFLKEQWEEQSINYLKLTNPFSFKSHIDAIAGLIAEKKYNDLKKHLPSFKSKNKLDYKIYNILYQLLTDEELKNKNDVLNLFKEVFTKKYNHYFLMGYYAAIDDGNPDNPVLLGKTLKNDNALKELPFIYRNLPNNFPKRYKNYDIFFVPLIKEIKYNDNKSYLRYKKLYKEVTKNLLPDKIYLNEKK